MGSDLFWLADFKINAGGKINIESRGTINISNSEINSNQNLNVSKPVVNRLFAADLIVLNEAKFTSKENNQVTRGTHYNNKKFRFP